MSSFNKAPKGDDSDSDDEVAVVAETEVVPVIEEDTTLANSDVCTKYQEAAKIVNSCIQHVATLVRWFYSCCVIS